MQVWKSTMASRVSTSRQCSTCVGACRCGLRSSPVMNTSDVACKADLELAETNPIAEIPGGGKSDPGSPRISRISANVGRSKQKHGSETTAGKAATAASHDIDAKRQTKPSLDGSLHDVVAQHKTRVTFSSESPKLHVLQPHTHRRHFEHHLLDHFSSEEMLARRDTFRQRDVWKEITPVSTTCEYKDSNFLTEGSPPRQPIFVKPHLTPTVVMSDGGAVDIADRGSSSSLSGWRRTPISSSRLCSKLDASQESIASKRERMRGVTSSGQTGKKYVKFKNESYSGPSTYHEQRYNTRRSSDENKEKIKAPESASKTWPPRHKTRKQDQFPSGSTGIASKTAQSQSESVATRRLTKGRDLQGRPQSVPSSSAAKCLRPGARNPTGLSRKRRCADAATQTLQSSFSVDVLHHMSSQTDVKPSPVCSEARSEAEESPQTTASCSDTCSVPSTEYDSSNDTTSATMDELSLVDACGDMAPIVYFKYELLERSKRIHNKLKRVREHAQQRKIRNTDVSSSALLMLDELEQIVVEGCELYDNFKPNDDDEEEENEEKLRSELRSSRRTCHILEYELRRAELNNEDTERVVELEEEIKLCRHVAVSLHWELQSADEKCQKVESHNTKLRMKLALAETDRSIYEKEVRGLRSQVDHLSLHASAVPTSDDVPARVNTIPELQRQIRFVEEECRVVLKRLVEAEKERDSAREELERYKNTFGEILLPARSLPNEEWKTKDLKIRIRMAEDQAGLLGRKVMQLEMENDNLNKQLEEKEMVHTDHSGKPTSSDMQFLEDEVEALRLALQEAEETNVTLLDDLAKWKDISMAREELLQKSRTAAPPCGSPLSDKDKTPNDVAQPWSLPGSKSLKLNESQSDLTISGLNSSDADNCSMQAANFLQTAIDAETQTVENLQVADVLQRVLVETDVVKKPQAISNELVRVLSRARQPDVTSVVSQLHNLALATRHLLDESPPTPTLTHHVIEKVTAADEQKQMRSVSTQCDCHPLSSHQESEQQDVASRSVLPAAQVISRPARSVLSVCQTVVLLFIIYVLATSMPFFSLVEFVIFVVLFVTL